MKITLDIPDEVAACIRAFIATQVSVMEDPATGRPKYTTRYADEFDFLEQQLATIVSAVIEQFPTEAVRQQLIARKQAQDAMLAASRPKLTRVP